MQKRNCILIITLFLISISCEIEKKNNTLNLKTKKAPTLQKSIRKFEKKIAITTSKINVIAGFVLNLKFVSLYKVQL